MTDIRVGIEATSLLGPRTGVGQYTASLCRALIYVEASIRLHYFYGLSWMDVIPDSENTNTRRRTALRHFVRLVDRSVRLLGPYAAILRKRYLGLAERIVFHQGIKKFSPNVIHATNSFFHPSSLPTVVTVHDISCFRHPETHPEQRVRWYQENFPKTIESAAHILVVSEFTKKELVDYFNVDPERITVTYNGVDDIFNPRELVAARPVLNKYGLNWRGYVLSVGTIEPRKNLRTLVDAYNMIPQDTRKWFPLVLVGMRGWKETAFIRSLEPLIQEGSVRVLGYVSQSDLPYLFSGARSFAYPSIYEGFGMPVMEAMASGVPVIASNRTSLPEVVGDSGIMVDPWDIHEWCARLQQLLFDEQLRVRLSKQGLQRAKEFTWKRCAKTTLEIYRRVSGQ